MRRVFVTLACASLIGGAAGYLGSGGVDENGQPISTSRRLQAAGRTALMGGAVAGGCYYYEVEVLDAGYVGGGLYVGFAGTNPGTTDLGTQCTFDYVGYDACSCCRTRSSSTRPNRFFARRSMRRGARLATRTQSR